MDYGFIFKPSLANSLNYFMTIAWNYLIVCVWGNCFSPVSSNYFIGVQPNCLEMGWNQISISIY